MREVNLNGIDLNLVPHLEALLRRRNVTRAAYDVGLSQPAMSRALARLRALLKDPLLVRGRDKLVLTPQALTLVPVVARALAELKGIFQVSSFDPATAERVIRIAAADAQTVLLGPPIMARLAREAPSISIEMVPYTPNLGDRMEDASIDFAFALATTPLPAGTRSIPLAADRLALVMRRGHPMARRKWTLADYGSYGHATVALLGDRQSDMDTILADGQVARKISFTSPHFMAALATVAATDAVTTVSETLARRFAGVFDLVIKRPPFASVALPLILVWSHVRDHDPVLTWFRGIVEDAADEVFGAKRRQ